MYWYITNKPCYGVANSGHRLQVPSIQLIARMFQIHVLHWNPQINDSVSLQRFWITNSWNIAKKKHSKVSNGKMGRELIGGKFCSNLTQNGALQRFAHKCARGIWPSHLIQTFDRCLIAILYTQNIDACKTTIYMKINWMQVIANISRLKWGPRIVPL